MVVRTRAEATRKHRVRGNRALVHIGRHSYFLKVRVSELALNAPVRWGAESGKAAVAAGVEARAHRAL
jgi:hypothetical protein